MKPRLKIKVKTKQNAKKSAKLLEDLQDTFGNLPEHWSRLSDRQRVLVPEFVPFLHYITGEVD